MVFVNNLRHLKLFRPLLSGANFADRMRTCAGALAGIGLTGLICSFLPFASHQIPILVAPLGASAVLAFAVPASPLAQPWAIIGGNTISAMVGVLVALLIPQPILAAGIAVGGAIFAMSLLRCLHPPGGAAALTGVIGGPSIHLLGFGFPLIPVALNSLLLVVLAWMFHRFSGHSYPHRLSASSDQAGALRPNIDIADIDHALRDLDESFDISREDLHIILRHAEMHSRERARRSKGNVGSIPALSGANDREVSPGKVA